MGRFLTGMALACAAWMVLGTTGFNESHVFADPGIVAAKAADPVQWSAVAAQQREALWAYLSPFGYGLLPALAFVFPPCCTLLWNAEAGVHKWINGALAVLLLIDLANMAQFNGYNSANGGYDGLNELLCYGLHGLFGLLCVTLSLGRMFGLALGRWCGKA